MKATLLIDVKMTKMTLLEKYFGCTGPPIEIKFGQCPTKTHCLFCSMLVWLLEFEMRETQVKTPLGKPSSNCRDRRQVGWDFNRLLGRRISSQGIIIAPFQVLQGASIHMIVSLLELRREAALH